MIMPKKPEPIHCNECDKDVDSEYFERHNLVHEVTKQMTERELLALIVLSLSDIKSKLNTLIAYEQSNAIRR